MKKIFLFLNILVVHFSYGQKCSCDSLFNHFKKDIQFELLRFNQIDWDNETKESYYTLMINCPVKALTKYVEDSIPAIRSIIFDGLAQKNADEGILAQILSNHKNDTAQYIDSPADVGMTWKVKDFMQMVLQWKMDGEIPNAAADFDARLERVKNRFRIIVPGEYHGTVSKDSLLMIDSLTCSKQGCKITSFNLASDTETITTNNIFSEECKQLLRRMKPGELLAIYCIIGVNSENKRVQYPSIELFIR
jgi:hypothetical protein